MLASAYSAQWRNDCFKCNVRSFVDAFFFQVPDEEEDNEESLAHADHSKNKTEA